MFVDVFDSFEYVPVASPFIINTVLLLSSYKPYTLNWFKNTFLQKHKCNKKTNQTLKVDSNFMRSRISCDVLLSTHFGHGT